MMRIQNPIFHGSRRVISHEWQSEIAAPDAVTPPKRNLTALVLESGRTPTPWHARNNSWETSPNREKGDLNPLRDYLTDDNGRVSRTHHKDDSRHLLSERIANTARPGRPVLVRGTFRSGKSSHCLYSAQCLYDKLQLMGKKVGNPVLLTPSAHIIIPETDPAYLDSDSMCQYTKQPAFLSAFSLQERLTKAGLNLSNCKPSDNSEDLQHALLRYDAHFQATGQEAILIFDETNGFTMNRPELFSELIKTVRELKAITVIIDLNYAQKAETFISKDLADAISFWPEPFNQDEAHAHLLWHLQNKNPNFVDVSDDTLNLLMDLTAGRPFEIDTLLLAHLKHFPTHTTISEETLLKTARQIRMGNAENVIESIGRQTHGLLTRQNYFTSEQRTLVRKVLTDGQALIDPGDPEVQALVNLSYLDVNDENCATLRGRILTDYLKSILDHLNQ